MRSENHMKRSYEAQEPASYLTLNAFQTWALFILRKNHERRDEEDLLFAFYI